MSQADPLLARFQEWFSAFMRLSMRNMIHYMKAKDLSISQIGAMFEITRGSTNVSDVGESLGISIAASSQMVDRLVQMGLLTRTEDRQDRRVKKLVVTEKGQRILNESIQARQGWLEELVAMLTPTEKQQVAAAVEILIERTKQLDQAAEPAR